MAYSAGVYLALQAARGKASEMWANDVHNKQWKLPNTVFNSITNRQALRIAGTSLQTLKNGRHCNNHDIYFLNDVNDTSSETYSGDADDCTFTGQKLGTDTKTYTTSDLAIFRRTVDFVKCKTEVEEAELRAQAILNIKKDIEIELEKDLLTFISSNNKGTFGGAFVPTTGSWDEDNDKWVVASGDADAEFLAEVVMWAEKFRMIDPVIVSGSAYYLDKIKANAEPGSGYQNYNALLNALPMFHNITNLDTITSATKFYLVDAATIGFIPSQLYTNTAPQTKTSDLYYWSDNLMNFTYKDGNSIMQVPTDWRLSVACTGASAHDVSEHYEGKAAGVFAESQQPEQAVYPNIVEISIE